MRNLMYFIVLVLVQVLILNNIHFLRLVTPFLYLYFIIKLPVGLTSSKITSASFLIGLTIDIFSNTPGMHAAACTLAGFSRPLIIRVLMGEELSDTVFPSYKSFGYGGFSRLVATLVVIHHLTLFLLESLTLFDPLFLSIRIVASITTVTLLICIVEAFNIESQKNGD
ncbi:MAG: rod shape-determining protein MreD [Tannerellaceae bacterium]|nr:rod shape-determining protein MreD [Tannerellaceae bacterium]